MSRGPLERDIVRRFVPFVVIGAVALASVILPPEPTSWAMIFVAAALSVAIAAAGLLLPWARLPRWTYVVPPLAYFVVIGLLRAAQGGSTSGYAPLALLPVLWVALTLGRRQVALAVAGCFALFVTPLLSVVDDAYGSAEWRRTILWTCVALVVGFSVESLVRSVRAKAREAESRASELAESERTMAAIAEVVRDANAAADGRSLICRAALEIGEGSAATITELEDDEWLVVTASSGLDGRTPVRVRLGEEPSGSEIAFTRGERLFVPDVRRDPVLAPRMRASAPNVVSVLYEPIVRGEETIGVLAVGWPERIEGLGNRQAQAVRVLAAEAGAAIERSDLLARLSRMSLTDELTGLPNRRAWEQELPRALARSRRTREPLSIAILDLDRFKSFNDSFGHLAGDALLKDAAKAWSAELRTGDLLARYGGEELVALLPGCDSEEALVIAERLRTATPYEQTCSVGVATWNGRENERSLLHRADNALYSAKRDGRNRVSRAA